MISNEHAPDAIVLPDKQFVTFAATQVEVETAAALRSVEEAYRLFQDSLFSDVVENLIRLSLAARGDLGPDTKRILPSSLIERFMQSGHVRIVSKLGTSGLALTTRGHAVANLIEPYIDDGLFYGEAREPFTEGAVLPMLFEKASKTPAN